MLVTASRTWSSASGQPRGTPAAQAHTQQDTHRQFQACCNVLVSDFGSNSEGKPWPRIAYLSGICAKAHSLQQIMGTNAGFQCN